MGKRRGPHKPSIPSMLEHATRIHSFASLVAWSPADGDGEGKLGVADEVEVEGAAPVHLVGTLPHHPVQLASRTEAARRGGGQREGERRGGADVKGGHECVMVPWLMGQHNPRARSLICGRRGREEAAGLRGGLQNEAGGTRGGGSNKV